MSETSSPSVHIHPISPSSSFSSTDSGLRSELTSDEEPDLGAFTTVLREWTHLQPPPRIPVQIRSATSSTTPTFQLSATGSEAPDNHSNNGRVTSQSIASSFTRPPSSSAHPEGSTVWAHAPIASYLYSGTPNGDDDDDEDEASFESTGIEGEYTPNSMASTDLTVEIVSETDFDQSNGRVASPPYPYPSDSGITLPLTLESDNNRLDSREHAHQEEEMETSETSRGRPSMPNDSQVDSLMTSVQLQSQLRPTPTEDSSSVATLAIPSVPLSTFVSDSPPTFGLNRSRNPEPPRTASDSSYAASGSASSSSLSLVSYQISETVSMPNSEELPFSNAAIAGDTTSASPSVALKTQRSLATSNSGSTTSFGTQRPQQSLHHSFHSTVAISQSSSLSSIGSPLLNPHSPLPPAELDRTVLINNMGRPVYESSTWPLDSVVNDLGTPDQPPSEMFLFDPPRNLQPEFRPVVDDDDEEDIRVERHAISGRPEETRSTLAPGSGYNSVYERPEPLTEAHESNFTQQPVNFQRHDRRELYDEDQDDLEEEYYTNSYVYTQGLAPRVIGAALTPRGIPPAPANSQPPVARITTTATTKSVAQPLNHSLLQTMHNPNLPQQRPNQHFPATQLQYQYQTNQSNTNTHATAPAKPTSSQSANNQPSSSHVYTPRGIPTQPSVLYPPQHQSYSISSSQYSFSQSDDQTTPESGRNNLHGYPYSLRGLHALPATYSSHDTSTLPSVSSFDSDSEANTSRANTFYVPAQSELSDDNSTIHADATQEQLDTENILLEHVVPSLGVLDGVLSFIAVERERARNNAVREGTTSAFAAEVDDTREVGSGEEGETIGTDGPGEAAEEEGEDDWKHIVGNDPDQPKRKRRRKRPPKTHTAAIAIVEASSVSGVADQDGTTIAKEGVVIPDLLARVPSITTSPKRKKKVKSTAPSISASTSGSIIPDAEGFRTPTKARSKEKEFLIPPPVSKPTSTPQGMDASTVRILRRPNDPAGDNNNYDSDFDGGRTPTNFDTVEGRKLITTEAVGAPINLAGKQGKRVGRREREREKAKRDGFVPGEVDGGAEGGTNAVEDNSFDFAYENDNNDEGDEPREDDDEQGEDNDSLSNLSLLKPPRKRDRSRRRKGRDTAHIHTMAGITGTYQSTPGTPGGLNESDEVQIASHGHEQGVGDIIEENDASIDVNRTPEKRKRTRTKRIKAAQSIPDLALDNEMGAMGTSSTPQFEDVAPAKPKKSKGSSDLVESFQRQYQNYLISSGANLVLMSTRPETSQPPPDSKRGRIITLARQLRDLFPEQREDLGRVISRLEKQGVQGNTAKKIKTGDDNDEVKAGLTVSRPVSIPVSKGKTTKGHTRAASEGGITGGQGFDFDEDQEEHRDGAGLRNLLEDEEEIDPRGRPPKKGDALVHVFIDHSNILIGLLSHLKRTQSYRKTVANKAKVRPLPAIISRAMAKTKASNQTDAASSAFAAVRATSSRPLPIPTKGDSTELTTEQIGVSVQNTIPLPSFATMAHSLPTTSVLRSHMKAKGTEEASDNTAPPEREANSDGYEYPGLGNEKPGTVNDSLLVGSMANTKEKKYLKHLWHAALTLILERGRPVTRRVVVTSSPLYQPMDAIEHLGYELRVFIRVPDFGDGQDRERYKDKDKGTLSKSNAGAKSAQTSPASNISPSGLPASLNKSRGTGHARHLSGNTSTESGSGGGAGSTNTSGSGGVHPYYGTPNNASQAKVKFREQGVDELLQLKLHQAIAATDHVPEGSTIVLATGDGNVGQFNEDGFLGPVRTALRRGWRVELYAWEDGLSRAWKREFGDGSDWGRRGLFRVIGMEQFASGLVEAIQ
ncbi:hypothetical protein HYPSUDRAFT_202129 [Hypholoma sublateritium FD-334 SS-4]|uniref:NYN domain-containing protein n=1 Tax=Hypholoma sublateritium (strain FD-334 SS-4) TaxID=945553 RepID=A0A0D2L6H6_HYPSF|nr:hypothetical protein HYPSUDRAFT_202129 [Hypholoma sublateritium FD-334 SS-4]